MPKRLDNFSLEKSSRNFSPSRKSQEIGEKREKTKEDIDVFSVVKIGTQTDLIVAAAATFSFYVSFGPCLPAFNPCFCRYARGSDRVWHFFFQKGQQKILEGRKVGILLNI